MKKLIINEDWEAVEVNDTSSLFVLIFKQGSNTAGYIKCYSTDDVAVFTEYENLIKQYANSKFEEPTSIFVIKVPATGQVKAMLEEAVYSGDETNPTKLEIINHLLDRADCEYVKEKVLMSLEEAKKRRKKKKKKSPKVTYTMGFPWYNDQMFNHHMGSCDCDKDTEDAADSANDALGDTAAGGDGLGGDIGGGMGESLIKEALTPLQKMQALEAGTRGFNAAAASDIKLMDNLILCAKNNLQKAAIIMLVEIQKRMNQGVWTMGPIPGLTMPGTSAASAAPMKTSQNSNTTSATNNPTNSTGISPQEALTFEPSDFDASDFALIENNKDNPSFLIGTVENFSKPLHWGIVLLILSTCGEFTKMTAALKEWVLKRITKTTLKQIIAQVKQNTAIIDKITDICNKDISEGVTKMANLTEAKRYVKRYYIRPQNIFCSNKAEILTALVKDVGDNNCSVYSLKALEDHDDVHLLQPKDIIYYYDDGILYDKNHVKVMDYDLNVKHEEERKKFGNVDAISDQTFDAEYEDRLTEEITDDEFDLDFDDVNVYGIKLKEGKEAEYTCCICGDDFEGYGNNPAPYKESGKCCDACNRKFIIPARLSQLQSDDEE